MDKICRQCNIEKQLLQFHNGTAKFGRKSICKACISNNYKSKKWVNIKNYVKVKYQSTECKYCNEEFTPNRKDKVFCSKLCSDKYSRSLRKEEINEYFRNKYNNDINRRLSSCLRSRLNKALKGAYKVGSAISDLGCTPVDFKKHLESQFQPNMTWNNYGKNGWHIDHIKPLSKFNLSNREELLEACNYSNLQPLWAKDNLSKGNKHD